MVDLAVLIYFIHHIAKSIQLPEVIAGIADDLMKSIDAEFPDKVGDGDRCRAACRRSTRASRCPNCSRSSKSAGRRSRRR